LKRAIVVGSGPNGLSAAIALARAGVAVTVYEAADMPGGSVRTEALTLPGFLHDAGAAVFPLTIASPFLSTLPLREHGLAWIDPDVPVAHPLDSGDAVALLHDLETTADSLGPDGEAWRRLMQPIASAWPALLGDALAPLVRVPSHPFVMARFGMQALAPAARLARSRFKTARARALFAGLAGHANIPLEFAGSAAPALVLAAAAHTTGWPIARGGAQAITAALVSLLRSLGGDVRLGSAVESLRDLPAADAVLLDVSARQFLRLAGASVGEDEGEAFRDFRPASGVCKVDWALSQPIPWTAELCRRAGTLHLGGTLDEIAASERDAWEGRASEKPYVLLSQPSVFDDTRAPAGQHTAWAYCHVPNGSADDFTDRMEAQVERFAPGFRATILARHTRTAPQMEVWNANLLGGDISGGAMTLSQIFRRPTLPPYRTPLRGVFLCSASTPPGGGVHGMCGYHAAVAAARHMGVSMPALPATL
jgi:phytoene dehydrogenase-like protein